MSVFTATVSPSNSKLFNYCLPLPNEVTAHFLALGNKRVIVVLNATEPFQAALTPIGQGVYVLKLNQPRMKQLALEIGDTVRVELFPDDSTYGLPVPEELTALWEQDEAGRAIFHQLTIGKQRTMLYHIGQGTDSEERLRRAVLITDHLITRNGKLNYRALAQELKKDG
ncbi:MAG: DUF1905 domain-containing protein [Lewinella sp.]|nr:DUF1905 domain-containing protein [Lewinella sp.]